MSNEPSKRIERMLRKWARNRRDAAGAGWPVHPATRRLLQGEVARTLGARGAARAGAGAGAGRGWLALFWPRLVWGGVGLALIALVWVGLPLLSKKPVELAAVDGNAPLAREPSADRTFNYAGEPASHPVNSSSAPSPAPPSTLSLTPALAPASTPTATRQTAALADERTQVVIRKRAVEADAELAAATKAGKANFASGTAPLPGLAAGGGGAAGAGPQALLELAKQSGAKPGEAKYEAENSELLERRKSDLVPSDRAVRVQDLADRKADRLKDMAKLSDGTLGAAPISVPAATPKPTVPQPMIAAARSESFGGVAGRIAPLAPTGPVPVTTSAPANSRSLAVDNKPQPGIASSSLVRKESQAAAAVLTAPTAPTTPAAPDGASEGVAQQNFVRLNAPESYRRNLQSPPSPALLQQFQIQRAGNVVTVVDEDGSVYQGQVIAAETAMDRGNRRLPEMKRKSEPAAAADKAVEKNLGQSVSQAAPAGKDADSFWFRASGTNRSLNQRVVFTGEFQSRTGDADAPVAEELAKRATLRSDLSATNHLQYGVQQRASGAAAAGRILGRAQVGANSEIQVEAVSSGSPRR